MLKWSRAYALGAHLLLLLLLLLPCFCRYVAADNDNDPDADALGIAGGDCVPDTSARRKPFQGTHHLGSYPSLPPSHGPQAAPGMVRFSHASAVAQESKRAVVSSNMLPMLKNP